MILIGQYDSSFVRRVGIALTLYELPFEHRKWSVFGDADRLRDHNPLTRVPTLLLQDGSALCDTFAILDYVDGLVEPNRRLFPVEQPARYQAMRIAALAGGLADKAVALFYELHLHGEPSKTWTDRCDSQIQTTLSLLDRERAQRNSRFWFGDDIGHADIALGASLRHLAEAHPKYAAFNDHPTLRHQAEFLESLPVFEHISQPFVAPA